jgi:8-oxo-dGTP diphosphatase
MSQYQYEYPRHHVAVDCIIFGYEEESLKILLSHRRFKPAEGDWSLVGGWVQDRESAEEAAARVLNEVTGMQNIFLEQVEVFSSPDRDPGGRVISIAYYAMIRIDKHNRDLSEKHGTQWIALENRPPLVFDHDQMVRAAHEKIKLKASYELLGQDLLPSKFTILQLRNLYETVFQKKLDPGNFRKKVLSLSILQKQKEKNTTDSKKGAYYYTFARVDENPIKDMIIKPF